MADQYLDVINFRKRGDSAFPHKIGSAKSNGKGGLNVYLDSLPLPDDKGQVTLLIQKRQERPTGGSSGQARRPASREAFLDEEIPFG